MDTSHFVCAHFHNSCTNKTATHKGLYIPHPSCLWTSITLEKYKIYINMAHLRFWLCLILMCYSLEVSEPRLLTAHTASNNSTTSYQPVRLDVKELVHLGFVFKVTNKNPRNLTRRSPGGPDPKHHWRLKRKLFSERLHWLWIMLPVLLEPSDILLFH